ncbi:NAD+ synthase [Lyngbya confervoides]|uniref:Glutamine-dependent NAD(+) synthetase n=1 Tax=Lyngbya confervoides BDU141951 TaxID=1574623 RepID=A0ABD4T8T8_9CYAN|nr:NAD+ synthase [Lyngbya confervoides]MCM1984747.1 NAD+ synthase [Lyngbya confervoides BDU141951]
MKIAIAQINPKIGDIAGNQALILAAAREAQAQGARLLLTPELSLCGYPPRDLLLQRAFVDRLEAGITAISQHLPKGIAALVGTVTVNARAGQRGEKPLFNSMVWLEAGQVVQRFHKRLLPTYDVFDENRYFAAGVTHNVMELAGYRIGITICEDLWNDEEFWGQRAYPVNPVAELVDQKIDWLVNLSASPFCTQKQRLRESLIGHAARRFRLPIIYGNQVGGNDDLIFDGRSLVVNPDGALVARARAFQSDLLILEASQAGFSVGFCAPELSNLEEVWQALVLGVRDYARKCGFSRALLGLSGGIDSSLVAAIAVAALDAENVLGVLMPSPYSSKHSISDALALATALEIHTQTLPIAGLMQGYAETLAPLFAGTDPGVAEENIQARIRGNLLMSIANKFNYLLLSTGNKSELAVGYCTLYGDMSGGLAAIADVPKTLVYDLCRWLNQTRGRPLIPESVLTKPPSAELRPDQTDQDSLPPYEVLDDILRQWVDQHQSREQIMASGHEPAEVDRVIQLVKRAEFKRKQAAPGLKITDRAFGTGWRMPIAAS